VGDDQQTLLRMLKTPAWAAPSFWNPEIKKIEKHAPTALIRSAKRKNHTMPIATAPDTISRSSITPPSDKPMDAEFRQWKEGRERTHDNTNQHMPVGIIEAKPGSYVIEKDDEDKEIRLPAWWQRLPFERAFFNILTRDHPLEYDEMLFDYSRN